jgi:hypothetical protein
MNRIARCGEMTGKGRSDDGADSEVLGRIRRANVMHGVPSAIAAWIDPSCEVCEARRYSLLARATAWIDHLPRRPLRAVPCRAIGQSLGRRTGRRMSAGQFDGCEGGG